MLQIIIGFILELVQHVWLLSTIFTKFFLIAVALKVGLEKEPSWKKYFESITNYSPLFVIALIFSGLANMSLGVFEEAYFKLFGEIVAFLYFLFLFWEY